MNPEEATLVFDVRIDGDRLLPGYVDRFEIPLHGEEKWDDLMFLLMDRLNVHKGPTRLELNGKSYLLDRYVWRDLYQGLLGYHLSQMLNMLPGESGTRH